MRALVSLLVVLTAAAAGAQSMPGQPYSSTAPGGFTVAAADARYLKLDASNAPLTGSLLFTPANSLDVGSSTAELRFVYTRSVTAPSGVDVSIVGGAATGSVILKSLDDSTDIKDSADNVELRAITSSSLTAGAIVQGTPNSTSITRWNAVGVAMGSQSLQNNTTVIASIQDGLSLSTGTNLFSFWGGGLAGAVATSLVVTGTELPTSSNQVITSASSLNWTPTETNAASGMRTEACNGNASDTITMVDVDGQYEGPGTVLGPQDCVTFVYQVDRWRQTGTSDNEP